MHGSRTTTGKREREKGSGPRVSLRKPRVTQMNDGNAQGVLHGHSSEDGIRTVRQKTNGEQKTASGEVEEVEESSDDI